MLYHGAQRVKWPNLSKISCLLSPLAIFLRFQAFQRYMISNVVFWWKVVSKFGHFAATLILLQSHLSVRSRRKMRLSIHLLYQNVHPYIKHKIMAHVSKSTCTEPLILGMDQR